MRMIAMCGKLMGLTAFLTLNVAGAFGQLSIGQARDLARTAIQEAAHADKDTFLSVHRNEDFEDEFCSFGWFRGGFTNPPCAFFFEVSRDGYEFHDGKVNSHAVVDGESVYYAVVSIPSGEVFRISGFKDSQEQFNRLAASYRIRIGDNKQALRYAQFFLHATREPMDLPTSVLDLRQLAERRFNTSFPDFAESERRFEHWWQKSANALTTTSFVPSTSQTNSGFTVTFLTLSSINQKHQPEGPDMLKVSLGISLDGQINGPHFEAASLP